MPKLQRPREINDLEVSMRNTLAILIGALCAAGSLQAAAGTATPSTDKDKNPPPSARHVKTAQWGFEAPQLFPLDPQEVQSQGAASRPGPRNRLLSPPHGGLVTAVDQSGMPGRE